MELFFDKIIKTLQWRHLMGLLAEVEPAPEPVLAAAGPAAPPLRPGVQRLVVQQGVLHRQVMVRGLEATLCRVEKLQPGCSQEKVFGCRWTYLGGEWLEGKRYRFT
jgi:hypothetical protein